MSPTYLIGMFWLILAIICDILSTIYMAKAEGFKNLVPLAVGGLLYFGSFVTCVLALKYMQAGILYVVWAGVGAVATIAIANVMLGQKLDTAAYIGGTLIVMGVTIISKYSNIDV